MGDGESTAVSGLESVSKFFRRWWAYFLLQYELITCTCMFEPWEKYFINGLVLTLFTLITYSSWVVLPPCLISALSYFGYN